MSLEKVDKSVGSFASSYAIICSILFYGGCGVGVLWEDNLSSTLIGCIEYLGYFSFS
jgi:hypothetical protein